MSYLPYLTHLTFVNLDGTTAAATSLFTTENAGQRFYPTAAYVTLRSVSGFVTVATISLGTNAATYTNIVAAGALTGLSAANQYEPLTLVSGVVSSVAPNTAIFCNVSIGAVATTYKLDLDLVGFYKT